MTQNAFDSTRINLRGRHFRLNHRARLEAQLTTRGIQDANKRHDPLFGCKMGWEIEF